MEKLGHLYNYRSTLVTITVKETNTGIDEIDIQENAIPNATILSGRAHHRSLPSVRDQVQVQNCLHDLLKLFGQSETMERM